MVPVRYGPHPDLILDLGPTPRTLLWAAIEAQAANGHVQKLLGRNGQVPNIKEQNLTQTLQLTCTSSELVFCYLQIVYLKKLSHLRSDYLNYFR